MPASASPTVAALLVTHDGARWLPTVLDGLARQHSPVTRVVAVDTGSTDESANLVERALQGTGHEDPDALRGEVVRDDAGTGFSEAVRAGLTRLHQSGTLPEWVWILHDDSTPSPTALSALLAAAAERPDVDVLGPKLREWPSLRRLLELGVTISGTGQRETGLERGEYDQGQHDRRHEVLAVNTAGMLVRREVLEDLGGFDPQLPVFGNDLDFGWRAAAAGHTTLVVPEAVVFHAEAAHRGVRRTALTGRHTHFQERRAALYTLLANTSGRRLPLQVVRLVLGTMLRVLGLLLVRAVREAGDELGALASVLGSPGTIRAARRSRREHRQRTGGDDPERQARVRSLLAPFWVPYRHGLDAVSDVAAAVTNQAADVAERRRVAAAERDPSSMAARRVGIDDEDDALADSGVLARLLTNPIAALLALAVLALVVAARAALGPVSGGALSPAPESVDAWWSLHLEAWHPLGQGTPVPAPAYVLPLALLGSLVTPTGAVSLLLLAAGPLAVWGAWRFLRVVARLVDPRGASRWLLLAGSVSYAAVPLTSGAWGAGRLGVVVASVLLPWVAHAALGFADPEADRRRRAGWRVALLLALTTAFAPVAWLLALAVASVAMVLALAVAPTVARRPSTWVPPASAVLGVPLLLAPWWLPLLVHGAGVGLLLDVGRQPADSALVDEGVALLLGRVGELGALGAPWPLGLVPLVLAVLALLPRATRPGVLACWMVALVVGVVALLLSLLPLRLGEVAVEPGLGVVVVTWQACLVSAAVLGAQGLVGAGGAPRARRASLVAVSVAAVTLPVAGLAWAVVDGRGLLGAGTDDGVPAYMVQSAGTGPEHGVLVLRGSLDEGLTYTTLRGDGIRLGEDEVVALSAEDDDLSADVAALVSRPLPSTVADLGAAGIEYVVMPVPADGRVAAGLDATGGLLQASAEDRRTRAWQVDRPLDPEAVSGPGSWWRGVLLALQAAAVAVVLVLSAPTVRGGRR